jgi:Protein of unknown function (DUF2281)
LSIIQTATEKMRSLPPEKQQEVLDFIEFLQSQLAQENTNIEQIEPISLCLSEEAAVIKKLLRQCDRITEILCDMHLYLKL